MPHWLVVTLFFVFAIHLLVFARLAQQRGGSYYRLVSMVFTAIVVSYGVRLAAPDWTLAGVPAFQLFRYVAWALSAVTVPWLIFKLATRQRG